MVGACFQPRLTRQPAESYGSYGSYGHTVAVGHRVRHPAAPAWHQPAESYGSYGSYAHTVAVGQFGRATLPGIGAAPPDTPARRVIRIIWIIRSYGHTAAWHCATLPRLPGIEASPAAPPDRVFFYHLHAYPSILAWAQDCPFNPGAQDCPKNPSPGHRRRCVSGAVLAASLTVCFFSPFTRPAINPGVGTGLPHSILAWAQDHRIAPVFPRKAQCCTALRPQTRRPDCAENTGSASVHTRPDCPENSVSVLLCGFLRQSLAVSSPLTPWCPWCHARASLGPSKLCKTHIQQQRKITERPRN